MKKVFSVVLSILTFVTISKAVNINTKVGMGIGTTGLPSPYVQLSCTPPTIGPTPNSYNFYRGSVTGGPYTFLGNSTTCAYQDSTVVWNTTYFYVATSLNTSTCPSGFTCESKYSNEATAVIMQNPVPNPPTGLSDTVIASNVNLKWNQEAVTSFGVYRKPISSSSYTLVATITKNTYVDKPRKGKYNYQVKAGNIYNNTWYISGPSNTLTVQVP